MRGDDKEHKNEKRNPDENSDTMTKASTFRRTKVRSSNSGQTDMFFTHNIGYCLICCVHGSKFSDLSPYPPRFIKIIQIDGEAAPTILSINESAKLAEMTEGDYLEVPSQ